MGKKLKSNEVLFHVEQIERSERATCRLNQLSAGPQNLRATATGRGNLFRHPRYVCVCICMLSYVRTYIPRYIRSGRHARAFGGTRVD